jgi:hypothetical protein
MSAGGVVAQSELANVKKELGEEAGEAVALSGAATATSWSLAKMMAT